MRSALTVGLATLVMVPALALAVETDRITVEDPSSGAVMFRVTSGGNVSGTSFTGDGSALTNVAHWKGLWNGTTAYSKDDCVNYNGASYIALVASTGADPVTGTVQWQLLAAKGIDGAKGEKGDAGAPGATGPQGPQGPQGPAGSPDTQSQILSKISTQADGSVLAMQQGATEAAPTIKVAVKNSNGTPKFGVTADGTILVNTAALESSGSKLNVINENNNSTFAFDSYANYFSYGGGGLFRFSRGSHTLKAPVQTGDRLGYFIFSGYDGTNFVNSIAVSGKVDGPVSAGVVPAKIAFETGAPRVERVVITSSGNVGVGAMTPSQKLEINGGLRINTASTKPSCDNTTRGTFWFSQGGIDVKDTVEVCAKDAGNGYDWRSLW